MSSDSVPPLVERAAKLARESGFGRSCLPEVGRLLQALTGTVREGTVGEIGTGYGVGAAWIVEGLSPSSRFVTVEEEVKMAAAVDALFHHHANVQVIAGDWTSLLSYGPFDLLFVDASVAKREGAERALNALALGGMAVLDDLTPLHLWPEEWRGTPDPVREFWLNDRRLVSTEVWVRARSAVILATRANRDV